ncbi:DUF4129 domain-containing protein [Paenibacillus alkalitolerans]|uniref:DUF4129 domain-containing protein n=1 Tax=Paenibacillus alkalitolerans TaxID=2799335 RepID=UPI0018F53480|nr:DUF4129 domain-containing protein [Paenibacillus alkalitolerans]
MDDHTRVRKGGYVLRAAGGVRKTALLWVACFVEQLVLLPVWLLLDTFLVPEGTKGVWLAGLPLLALVGTAAGIQLNALWAQWAAGAAVGAVFAVIAAGTGLYAVPLFAAGFFTMLLSMSISNRAWEPRWYWIGVAVNFIGCLVFGIIPGGTGKLLLLTVTGGLCTVIALYASNVTFLRGASLSERRDRSVPAPLRNHNRVYVGAILVISVVLTAMFGNVVGTLLWSAFKSVLRWLLQRPQQEEQPAEPPAQTAPPQPILPDVQQEPGLFAKLLDILFYTITVLILAAVAGYVAYWLYKNGGGIWRNWVNRLIALLRRSKRVEEGAGYTDEETVVFDWTAVKADIRNRWLGRFGFGRRGERWEQMRSNGERVRYLFRRWMRSNIDNGYEAKPHLTPLETGQDIARWAAESGKGGGSKRHSVEYVPDAADSLIALYYKARYSGKDVTDDEVENVRARVLK